jgi:hypothetical protein
VRGAQKLRVCHQPENHNRERENICTPPREFPLSPWLGLDSHMESMSISITGYPYGK